jgi:hypothetical protein
MAGSCFSRGESLHSIPEVGEGRRDEANAALFEIYKLHGADYIGLKHTLKSNVLKVYGPV